MRRVVLTGSECTGKTTLASRLAGRFAAPWSGEYSRDYAAQAGRPLCLEDVEPIACGQLELLHAVKSGDAPLVLHDTDLLSIVLYARHYYGRCPEWIVEEARLWRAELYLLCAPDLPWLADGVRDRGERRIELHGDFTAILAEFGCRVALVTGRGEEREDAAHAAINAWLHDEPAGAR